MDNPVAHYRKPNGAKKNNPHREKAALGTRHGTKANTTNKSTTHKTMNNTDGFF